MSSEPQATVRVTRYYDSAPERVFDAWLDPALIGKWMFGPTLRDEEVLHIKLDPRVGGGFSFLVRRAGEEIDHVGKYLELDRPRRLAFSWAVAEEPGEPSQVSVELTRQARGCDLALTHQLAPGWAEFAGSAEDSWTKMLAALADTLASFPDPASSADSSA